MTRSLCVLAATIILTTGCGEKPATEMVDAARNQPAPEPIPQQDEPALPATTENPVVAVVPVSQTAVVVPPTPFEKLCKAYASGDGDAWSAAEKELFEQGHAATPSLVAALNDGAAHERELAASMLAQIGSVTPEARTALKTALKDESLFVQANAVATLCAIEDDSPEVLAALTSLLQQEDKDSRRMAVSSAGNLGAKAAALVPAIKQFIEDEDTQLRDAATAAIARINGEAPAPAEEEGSVILPASSSKTIDD